jgi:MYXO-CTERM domain-containing protein
LESPIARPLESWDFVSAFWTPTGPADKIVLFGGYDDVASFVLDDLSVTLVPAPGAAGLLAIAGLAAARRRR